MSTTDIYNYLKVDERILTGGQPTEAQLRAAAEEGIRAVINLVPYNPENSLQDESGLAASLGMVYTHIPVDWSNPTEADFEAFEGAMKGLPEGQALIHCAANFRATAFYSLYAQKHLGWTEARAEEFRASIWRESDYPAWEEFIRIMRAKLG